MPLNDFTTEQLCTAIKEAGSLRGAASALGLHWNSSVYRRLSTASLGKAAPPIGFQPKKITTNKRGRVTSVRSVPEAIEDLTRQPIIPAEHYVSGISTLLDSEGGVTAQWVKTNTQKESADAARWTAIKLMMDSYQRFTRDPLQVTAPGASELCNVIVIGDHHFGMLAQRRETEQSDWDIKIANDILRNALTRLATRLPSAAQFILVNIGDFFHQENNANRTPRSNHQLDGDSRFVQVSESGCLLMAALTDMLLSTHQSGTVYNIPGNHDPDGARWLNLWMRAWFRGYERVTITDNANPFQYHRFGATLMGMYHGDAAKLDKLPMLMAAERRQDWAIAKFHRWITGHHHTYFAQEFPSCLVEKFPTLAPQDYYARHAGYLSERALYGFTLHINEGEIGRCKVLATEL